MNSRQWRIAIENTGDAEARKFLEDLAPLFADVIELERTFAARIDASKAARGEPPTKLRKARREELAGYAQDAEDGDARLLRDFAALPGAAVVYALSAGLETDLAFWGSLGLKHAHPAERPIVEASIAAKRRLRDGLAEFLRRFPLDEGDC
jgi:hypothetical protein